MIQNRIQRLLGTVLDPQGQPAHGREPLPLAPRLDALDGKTVYLVDVKFGGGYQFLQAMQGWFSRNMPAVKTVLRRKAGNMFMDDLDLWAEIKEKSDAVILGVGG